MEKTRNKGFRSRKQIDLSERLAPPKWLTFADLTKLTVANVKLMKIRYAQNNTALYRPKAPAHFYAKIVPNLRLKSQIN